jgi:hypothetical protein
MLPQGLRLAEHPSYTRRYAGQNLYVQPLALSVGHVTNEAEYHVTLHTRDPLRCLDLACATFGAAGYYERRLGETWVVGAQARAAFFDEDRGGEGARYVAGALVKKWLAGPEVLLMGQLDVGLQTIPSADYSNKQLTALAGATWFLTRGVSLTGAGEAYLEDVGTPDTERYAGVLELQYFPIAHTEVVLYNRLVGAGDAFVSMLQLHYYL